MEFEPYPTQHFGVAGYPSTTAFNMGGMVNTLPDYQMRNYSQQPFQHQLPPQQRQNPGMLYQVQQGAQFAGQTAPFNPAYAQSYPPQFQQGQQYRPSPMSYSQFQSGMTNHPQGSQGQQFYTQQPMIQPSAFQPQTQSFFQSPISHYGPGNLVRVGSGLQPPDLHLDSSVGSGSLPYPQYIQQSML